MKLSSGVVAVSGASFVFSSRLSNLWKRRMECFVDVVGGLSMATLAPLVLGSKVDIYNGFGTWIMYRSKASVRAYLLIMSELFYIDSTFASTSLTWSSSSPGSGHEFLYSVGKVLARSP